MMRRGVNPVSRSRRPRPGSVLAPGVTLLEVVLAVVMLGMVAAALTGATSAVESIAIRNRQQLAAYDLANRLVLSWLDNPETMPPSSRPLDYGPHTFMWDSWVDSVEMKINETQKRTSGTTPQSLDRFQLITITVYEAEGDGPQPYAGEELATLSRMYDPAAPRNPESMKNIAEGSNLERLLKAISGERSGGSGSSRERSPRRSRLGREDDDR